MSQPTDDRPVLRWTIRSGDDLGRAIAEIRHERGLTQEEFAEQAGISRVYLAQIESGRSSSVLEHMLRALRRAGAQLTVTLHKGDGTD